MGYFGRVSVQKEDILLNSCDATEADVNYSSIVHYTHRQCVNIPLTKRVDKIDRDAFLDAAK
jgi:hypothetical protein